MAVQISGNDITVPRDTTVTRNLTVGGVLTYEDVTNVDSVGLVTARTGIEIGARPGVAASISVDGNMIVSGISTFNGDVKLDGGNLVLGDSGGSNDDRIKLGASGDLSIYHDGSNSYIIDSGTGDLVINTDSTISLNPNSGGHYGLRVISNGSCELYEANSKKLETTSTGISVTGAAAITGAATLGNGSGLNFGDTGARIIGETGASGYLRFDTNGGEKMRIAADGDMGVGTNSPSTRLHVSGGDGLLVERSSGTSIAGFKHSGATAMNIYFQNSGSSNHPYIGSTNENLILGTGNAERARIDSNGYLVKASGLTAAFNVSGGNMTRSDASGYICQFNDDSSSGHFDSGNNFNTSTYKFVAPVSGYYYFFTNIRLDAFNTGYIRTAILSTSYNTNTTYYTIPSTGHVITYADNGSIQTVQTSTVMYLPATHEAWVYQDPSADTSYQVYLNESSFGGYFIG